MQKSIDQYVANCEICQRTKLTRTGRSGLLNPLLVLRAIWKKITVDFSTGFPKTKNFDAIMVVVDRLSKMVHYIPTNKEVTAKETAALFL